MKSKDLIIGKNYKAIGCCGITDGIEVKGKLTKVDRWGVYLTCKRGRPHLCDKNTLSPL